MPQQLYEDPDNLFVAGFIGSPRMNFLKADLAGGTATLAAGGSLAVPGFADAADLLVGLRPEHFIVGEPADLMFDFKVDVVENLGGTRYFYGTTTSGESLIVEARDGVHIKPGAAIQIGAPQEPGAAVRNVGRSSACGGMSAADHILWYKAPATDMDGGACRSATAASARWSSAALPARNCRSTRRRCGPAAPMSRSTRTPCRIWKKSGSSSSTAAMPRRKRSPIAISMARPHLQMSYQPAGNLWLDFAHADAEDYRRALDLDRALTSVSYAVGGVRFRREAFISPVDQVLVLRVTADVPGALSATIRLTSEQPGEAGFAAPDTLTFSGTSKAEHGIASALRFALHARVIHQGGSLEAEADGLRIVDADSFVVLLDAATSFRRYDDVGGDPVALVHARLDAAAAKSVEAMQAAHEAEHQRLYRRMTIDLGTSAGGGAADRRAHRAEPGQSPIRRWLRSMSSSAAI